MNVGQRFDRFLSNIKLTADQIEDGRGKHASVRRCLNKAYYNSSSETANSMLTGSWGKDTHVRPPRDIDVLFDLPSAMYWDYEKKTGNKQSQILQHVKSQLKATFSLTDIKGDGPVVMVNFASWLVEVVPAFKNTDGTYRICITANGGRYDTFAPNSEITNVSLSSSLSNGNARPLIRMLKTWQRVCSVPLKSFYLELTAINFLSQYQNRDKSTTWYDFMCRDYRPEAESPRAGGRRR